MLIRLLAACALFLSASGAIAVAAEGQMVQQQCNCAKCQAARKAAENIMATHCAQPQGLYAAPPPAEQIQQTNFHEAPLPPTNCPPGGGPQAGWGTGPNSFNSPAYAPNGWNYPYGHPGQIFTGGRYGYHGGAHGTPGYPRHMHMHREYVGPQGPPSAAVAYPYYTVRGPRDFFIDNPPSIGR
jgi:hypothetical protein